MQFSKHKLQISSFQLCLLLVVFYVTILYSTHVTKDTNYSPPMHTFAYGIGKNSCTTQQKIRSCLRYAQPSVNATMSFIKPASIDNVLILLKSLSSSSNCIQQMECVFVKPFYFQQEREYKFNILDMIQECSQFISFDICMTKKLKAIE